MTEQTIDETAVTDAAHGTLAGIVTHPAASVPGAFTQAELGWLPWLEPADEATLTDRQYEGLVDRSRAKSDYFRLLARDPDILRARTLTDKDIFYNAADGLPRAERELAAAATSRFNGCIFCASVHARFATHHSKRHDDVQRLLDQGVDASQDAAWRAVIDAAVALADAGWSTDGIVTVSQLVSFLAFQLRVAAGLRLLTTEEAA